MPFTVCVVEVTALPSRVMLLSGPAADSVGSIACNPFAAASALITKLRVLVALFQVRPANEDWLRPSIHSSSCRALTTGTLRASADVMMASEPACGARSVCMLAVKTP